MTVEDLRIHAEGIVASMQDKRNGWFIHWRELANSILPRRYRWLILQNEQARGSPINRNIIDSTGTLAARTLASGMLAGVTSPTRRWFKLKIEGHEDDEDTQRWLAICEKRMMRVFQESNFYSAMAIMYFDLVVFGTAVVLIYEDFDNVIHCFNPCAGEYFVELNDKFVPDTVGREFTMTQNQLISMFGLQAMPDDIQQAAKTKNPGMVPQLLQNRMVQHLIEPNKDNYDVVPKLFKWREIYWLPGSERTKILRAKGFHEWPGMSPRWDVQSNDPYGRSPGMDALGDIGQLQQETRRKAQAIDKMVNPPLIADVVLKNNPMSMLPGGVTYVAGLSTGREGAKPLYEVMPPIAEMKADIQEIQQRIKITFHNDLFTGITDLQTVRTATEIDARREEKLILLGPVLERIIGQEGLGAVVDRVWGIMWRGRLLPPPPQSLGNLIDVQVDYISMLALAQKGLETAAIEKTWGFAGSIAAVKPGILDNLDEDETMLVYADALGTTPRIINDRRKVKAIRDQREAEANAAKLQHVVETANTAAQGAQTLSETPVGGGRSALNMILGTEGNA